MKSFYSLWAPSTSGGDASHPHDSSDAVVSNSIFQSFSILDCSKYSMKPHRGGIWKIVQIDIDSATKHSMRLNHHRSIWALYIQPLNMTGVSITPRGAHLIASILRRTMLFNFLLSECYLAARFLVSIARLCMSHHCYDLLLRKTNLALKVRLILQIFASIEADASWSLIQPNRMRKCNCNCSECHLVFIRT